KRIVASNFFRQSDGGEIDLLDLASVTGSPKLLACAKKCQGLQHLRTCIEKLAMELSQCIRIFNTNFWRELATAAAGTNLFAAGTAVDISAALQFDEIATVANNTSIPQKFGNAFHIKLSVSTTELVTGAEPRLQIDWLCAHEMRSRMSRKRIA